MTKNFNFNTLSNIDGIGDTQIKSLKNFFSDKINLSVINELKRFLVIANNVQSTKGIFKNKTFMFTGKLEDISRSEAKSLIEKNAGKIVSNVSKKLDYLVIGINPTNRKVIQAKELNVKVIDQKEWQKMLN
jgi:DNA ligase (NAD+)